ncbi:ribosomal large subunit pseudouridine synthase B [Gottschalkia purinilytica]|uniref:Pseudouridine synthase n=1 Tax=Gottschalkia purinilytica TaxID=1503 RepID=A0A0L0WFG1_GOTPU|nr:pseudouridine synthase [Gottschalkia purinilytica]KNF10160.1 ribosomal large subunit pseudouridine synthase B [Gottschalkia purinilytica]
MGKVDRLDKILANLGYGSRKDIKSLAKQGIIKVDGKIIKDSSFKLDPLISKIEVDDEEVFYRKYIYIMMNKPNGVVSSTDDPISETVVDLIEDKYKVFNPFPVGRLDKDTEGLLILSNDGQLAHRILSPKKHVKKTYYAEIEGIVDEKDIIKFKEGVYIEEEYKTLPAELEILESDTISKINLTIVEGKFHQVKRMFQAVDKKVIYLKRISMGALKLDESLKLGDYRELTENEINLLEK